MVLTVALQNMRYSAGLNMNRRYEFMTTDTSRIITRAQRVAFKQRRGRAQI